MITMDTEVATKATQGAKPLCPESPRITGVRATDCHKYCWRNRFPHMLGFG
jgi:hypothetical protein